MSSSSEPNVKLTVSFHRVDGEDRWICVRRGGACAFKTIILRSRKTETLRTYIRSLICKLQSDYDMMQEFTPARHTVIFRRMRGEEAVPLGSGLTAAQIAVNGEVRIKVFFTTVVPGNNRGNDETWGPNRHVEMTWQTEYNDDV